MTPPRSSVASDPDFVLEMPMNLEDERQQKLAEAREDRAAGPMIEEGFGPGSLGYHELLDRAFLLMDNWETFIATHPTTLLDPERYRKAQEIADAMAAFYQLVGRGDIH
jgi:hypothetical protein